MTWAAILVYAALLRPAPLLRPLHALIRRIMDVPHAQRPTHTTVYAAEPSLLGAHRPRSACALFSTLLYTVRPTAWPTKVRSRVTLQPR